jgi:hypothetical protein
LSIAIRPFGKTDTRSHADADHDEIGVESIAALENDAFAIDCRDSVFEGEI